MVAGTGNATVGRASAYLKDRRPAAILDAMGETSARETSAPRTTRAILGGFALLGVVAIALGIAVAKFGVFDAAEPQAFPAVSTAGLDPRQAKIVELLHTEFDAAPPGEKYSEGVDEPWCADFVSWIMREAGMPFANPNSGSWRIPGVYTLQEFYTANGRFVAHGTGYQPTIGDTVLYSDDSTFGQHTNVVVANDAGTLTTVGGNEGDEIRVSTVDLSDAGIVGYGVL